MKKSRRPKRNASALVITMFVIFLVTVSIGIAMNVTSNTFRQTDSSRDFSALRSAAEGALDFGYGILTKQISNYYGPVNNSRLTIGSPPVFTPFVYASGGALTLQGTDQYGSPVASMPPSVRINLDNYPGWYGFNTSYLASVKMSGTFVGNRTVSYAVKRAFNYSVVPLFQATAFFEDNMELYRTAPMTIGGLVHTNSKAYVSSSVDPATGGTPSLTFSGNLSFAGGYVDGHWLEYNPITHVTTDRDAPPEAWNWSGYRPNSSFPPGFSGGGKDQQIDQVSRIEPLGKDAKTLLDSSDTNRNNDSMRELIEPPNTYVNPLTQQIVTSASATDPQTIADRRLYNKAGIRIRISGSSSSPTVTITTANGASISNGQKSDLSKALSSQTIYDRREGKNIDVTSFDIAKAIDPLSKTSNFNNIIYIDDTRSTGADPKAIRLVNGSTLPDEGLTVASQNAVYIQGDYNTSGTRVSSAVFADAVTILSNAWKDTNAAADLSSRIAGDTTVNTAIVAGFIPSGWTNPVTGATYEYSGGLNNFPRFLEDWRNHTFAYTGSMIELFTSASATGQWDTGSNYQPPDRVWNFDSNFVNNPPPGSLDAVSISRGQLVRF